MLKHLLITRNITAIIKYPQTSLHASVSRLCTSFFVNEDGISVMLASLGLSGRIKGGYMEYANESRILTLIFTTRLMHF